MSVVSSRVPEEAPGILERFLFHAAARPAAPALMVDGESRSWTYSELLAEMERWRGALSTLGVGPGSRVLLILPPCPEFIQSFYALLSLGAMTIPTSPRQTEYELGQLLDHAQPAAVIANADLPPALLDRIERAVSVRAVLFPKERPTGRPDSAGLRRVGLHELAAERQSLRPPPGDAIVTCHYTYKGRGYPLGAPHRYADWCACLDGVDRAFPHELGAAQLLALPMHAAFGLVTVMLPLVQGGRVVVARDHGRIPVLLAEHEICWVGLVPQILRGLLAQASAQLARSFHPGLEVITGGSFLMPSLAGAASELLGREPFQGYGLSETLPVLCNYPGRSRSNSLGAILPRSTAVFAIDETGCPLEPGQAGELAVAGPTVMKAFAGWPHDGSFFLDEGAFRTGDLGYVDHDGFVFFLGRRLPITKVSAQMVDLVEVERLLLTHPSVINARAYIREQDTSEELCASVICKDLSVAASDLRSLLSQYLSRHKVPRRIRITHAQQSKAAA
ncbi:MAG: acyl--CoA ligase [Deltaproteobacteria bacterium]|nr:acyl--CoA ligase [Deltaproteobacteria bacterium]